MNYIIQNINGRTWNQLRDPATGDVNGWRNGTEGGKLHFSNAWFVGMNFRYAF